MIGVILAALVQLQPQVRALHAQGEAALAAGEHLEAARLFKAAVTLQPQNLGYLGLGEALLSLGRCSEAAEALDAVADAPETPESPARYATPVAAGLRRTLEDRCPGQLLVRCEGAYRLDDGPEAACGSPIEVAAGRHVVRGAAGAALHFEVRGLQTIEVVLPEPLPPPPAPPAAVASAPVAPPPPPEPDRTLAWTLLAAGGAGLGAALAFHLGPTTAARGDARSTRAAYARYAADADAVRADDDRFDAWRHATLATYLGGAALALTGGALLIDW